VVSALLAFRFARFADASREAFRVAHLFQERPFAACSRAQLLIEGATMMAMGVVLIAFV
jgi:hypothetical protein